MLKPLMLTLAAIIMMSGIPTANAQETKKENLGNVQIRVLTERSMIKAGESIEIATQQSIRPHWHTYWINPGDSGTPTRIEWTLPEGFKISEIQWPTPAKIPYGPLLNYGYEDNVVLLQTLTAPKDYTGGEVTLSADIELLVCKEECIPEYGTYTLTLNPENSAIEDNSAFIEAAKSKIPTKTTGKVEFFEDSGNLTLIFNKKSPDLDNINLETVNFLPIEWGFINNPAKSTAKIENNTLIIEQQRGDRELQDIKTLNGVLSYETKNGTNKALTFSANKTEAPAIAAITQKETQETAKTDSGFTVAHAILFALIGGAILNLMPCVFPVLSIKALSLVKTAEKHPNVARLEGLSYTAGVILSFVAIAGLLIILKSTGAEIGWGFQLQNPIVITVLATLLYAIGLNLMGFFEFGKAINIGNKLTQGNGYGASFFTGVLATIVATPCTAPFMAGAIGFALTQSAFVNLLIFASLGLGLALPYLALSFIPALQKILPKPGAWMDVFKQALAFPILLSAIWLVWVLSKQTGSAGVLSVLLAMIALTFAIWIFKHSPKNKIMRAITKTLGLFALLITAALVFITHDNVNTGAIKNAAGTSESTKEFSQNFTPETLNQYLEGNDPIFVEMTAAWCITCKVNQAVAINKNATRTLFADNNVNYLIGDWTNQDKTITQYLVEHGRNGVPLYVYYGPRNSETGQRPDAYVLPQILTPGIIAELFKR